MSKPNAENGSESTTLPTNFIRQIIDEDNKTGKHGNRVATRFPPEPNGYLHIGHAKSICLNFGIARDYKGICNLRFDDTNPVKEDIEYVNSIQDDVRWLGFEWTNLYYAADYFEKIYDYAVDLIKLSKAYVDELTAEQIREHRGTLTQPGRNSPYRDRSVEENLDLFSRMRKGEFKDGEKVLRAKIDMASPNINMRDPVLYRIKHAHHHRTGDKWCIYPMYDYAHPLSDMIEGITHSLCTLEFEDHRPFYDWVLETLKTPCRPQQIEFSRLNVDYTMMSKRYLLQMVQNKIVNGWDDPRMPTIQGMRRRGITPKALRDFVERTGVTKKNHCIEIALLENCVREDLDKSAPRALAVLKPLRVVIENFPEDREEQLEFSNHPQRPELGTRKVPFGRVIYIEQDDFMENPPKGFFRLVPGGEVRLRSAYFLKCERVVKDEKTGAIIELRCTYDPTTKGGSAPDGRKVKGTIHWVSEKHGVKAEVRLYDRLFNDPNPTPGDDYVKQLNPKSLEVLTSAILEPSLANARPEDRYQFERNGYFVADRHDATAERLVFNRTVTLRDSWGKANS